MGYPRDQGILDRLDRLNYKMNRVMGMLEWICNKERLMMVSIQDIQANASAELDQIRAETDLVNSVKMVVDNQNTKLDGLQKHIADLIAGGSVSPDDLQKLSDTVDAIRATDTANAQVVSDAVVAGTPAAEPPADGGSTSGTTGGDTSTSGGGDTGTVTT
jgi:hypothetical protein